MKQHIEQLCRIAGKERRRVLGLMSGTSLDGLDMALCEITGHGTGTSLSVLSFETAPYTSEDKAAIMSVFARKEVNMEKLCLLNGWVARRHAGMVNDFLGDNGFLASSVDLLASHGQTVYHAPLHQHGDTAMGNGTLQIGDGDHLAVTTGIITISDFRQKHIAAGGEGAPLALYGDYLLFSKHGEDRIMLNMGGIANFTWLPASLDMAEVFSTDTGPGNTMLDAYARRHFNVAYDADAAIAGRGFVSETLLAALCDDGFFAQDFPRTTGPEWFNLTYLSEAMRRCGTTDLAHEDVMATLTAFTAETIASAIKRTGSGRGCRLFASGGGVHNPMLMQLLADKLPGYTIDTTGSLSVNPDAKEAVLFAILANECVAGSPFAGSGNRSIPAVTMGKISLPQ